MNDKKAFAQTAAQSITPRQHRPALLTATLAALLTAACSPDTPSQSATPQVTATPAVSLVVREVTDADMEREAQRIGEQVNLVTAEGLEIELWASEKLVGDPVAIDVDHQGRIWATVTNRSNNSEFDIRGWPHWEITSMTFATVEDRRQFLRTELAPEKSAQNTWLPDRNQDGSHDWRDLAVEKEEIILLEDTTGNGRANTAKVVIADFNEEVSDVLGGVLFDNQTQDVFAVVAPDAWRLRDQDGDGVLETKESLAHGFGVHIGFSGHNMSGVIMGPDGRIYYGIGDIGMSVTDRDGKNWHYPNQGVIVRSEPDGSNFEVFAAGLRNTHEFVFDKYGNLISVDNDGDHVGEYERIVYPIDGSDTGWRTHWQLGKYKDPKNNTYKVWMDEDYFKPHFEGQSALILPPIAPYHSGPAGMVYNPGTALSDEWQDHFFVAEFVGSAPRSGINAFTLKPKGASFELASDKNVFRGVQGTGLSFGPEGALYMSDWIEGWGRNEEGRIWKLDTPATVGSEARQDTAQRLAEDFAEHASEQLLALLNHADMRVRQKAQFELVARDALATLEQATAPTHPQLTRIHGMWGLGQVARKETARSELLMPLLLDKDPEIRAQAARLIGDVPYAAATDTLITLLKDESLRVQLLAAQALGRIGAPQAVQPLIAMLEANNDKDIYLRQGGAIALTRIGDEAALAALKEHSSEAVRIAAVIALNGMKSPALAGFLSDSSEFVVTNAARAISDDEFVVDAMPALAQLLGSTRFTNEPLLRRAINANLYEGSAASAERLVAFSQNKNIAGNLRAEAINTLAVWGNSSIFDRVTGLHRGAINNEIADVRTALAPVYKQLLVDKDPQVREASVLALGELEFTDTLATLAQVLREDAEPSVRIAALNTLNKLGYEQMSDAVFTALKDRDQDVRMAALNLVPTLGFPVAQVVEMHEILLNEGTTGEQQAAITSLANVTEPEAHALLAAQMEKLIANEIAPEVQLELITAAEQAATPELQALLATYENAKDKSQPMEVYREALYGGNPGQGLNLFRYDSTAQCVRCHVVGHRGSPVGPELTSIAKLLTREQLLEALVDPAARIAPGYGRVTAILVDGQRIEGFFESETDTTITLVAGDHTHVLTKADVVATEGGVSGMPPMGLLLTKAQLRDIVAYIATLDGSEAEAAPSH